MHHLGCSHKSEFVASFFSDLHIDFFCYFIDIQDHYSFLTPKKHHHPFHPHLFHSPALTRFLIYILVKNFFGRLSACPL